MSQWLHGMQTDGEYTDQVLCLCIQCACVDFWSGQTMRITKLQVLFELKIGQIYLLNHSRCVKMCYRN